MFTGGTIWVLTRSQISKPMFWNPKRTKNPVSPKAMKFYIGGRRLEGAACAVKEEGAAGAVSSSQLPPFVLPQEKTASVGTLPSKPENVKYVGCVRVFLLVGGRGCSAALLSVLFGGGGLL